MPTQGAAGLYYLVSTRHTHPKDQALCFWRPDGRGYTYRVPDAGVYTQEFIQQAAPLRIAEDRDTVAVPMATVLRLRELLPTQYDGTLDVVKNTAANREALGLWLDNFQARHPYKL